MGQLLGKPTFKTRPSVAIASTDETPFLNVPAEVTSYIVEQLDSSTCLNVAQVNRAARHLIDSHWKKLYDLRYPHSACKTVQEQRSAVILKETIARQTSADISDECHAAQCIRAQLSGLAGTQAGDALILANLVKLGRYDSAADYLRDYPPPNAASTTIDADRLNVTLESRQAVAEASIKWLLEHAGNDCSTAQSLARCLQSLARCCDPAKYQLHSPQRFQGAMRAAAIVAQGEQADPIARVRGALFFDTQALKSALCALDTLCMPDVTAVSITGNCPSQKLAHEHLVLLLQHKVALEPSSFFHHRPYVLDALKECLLESGKLGERASQTFCQARTGTGSTWLHDLVKNSHHVDVAEVLIARGASLFTANDQGVCPLALIVDQTDALLTAQHAIGVPWPEEFQLLRQGDDAGALTKWQTILARDPVRVLELLRCATWTGSAPCTALALEHYAPDAATSREITSYVSKRGCWAALEVLASAGITDNGTLWSKPAVAKFSAPVLRKMVASSSAYSFVQRPLAPEVFARLCALHAESPLYERHGNDFLATLLRAKSPLTVGAKQLSGLRIVQDMFTAQRFHKTVVLECYADRCTSFNLDLFAVINPPFHSPLWQETVASPNDFLESLLKELHPQDPPAALSLLAWAAVSDLASGRSSQGTKFLYDKGARFRTTEMHLVASWLKKDISLARYIAPTLIRAGIPANLRDRRGNTFLHHSATRSSYDELVGLKANPYLINFRGQLPLRP